MEIRDYRDKVPAGNYTSGRKGWKPGLFVLHTTEGSYEGSCSWFCNPKSEVSDHYFMGLNGEVTQCVNMTDTAYACGTSKNPNNNRFYGLSINSIVRNRKDNANYYTINYEIVGHYDKENGRCTITQKQIDSVIQLIAKDRKTVESVYGNIIPIDSSRIIGHFEIAPIAKPYCGRGFPYSSIIRGILNYNGV